MPNPGKSFITGVAYYPGNPTNVSMNTLNIPKATLVIDYTNAVIYIKTSTTDNSAFNELTNVTSGTITSPVIADGLTATGSAANTFAGSTGTFITSTGAGTLSGTTTVAANKNLLCASGTTLFDFSLGSGIFKTTTGVSTFGGSTNNMTNALTFTTAGKGIILKQGSNALCGTFVCNGVTPVTVSNTAIAVTDAIIISLGVVGGTVGALPAIQTITASTGFTVAGTASDTSTYNYAIIKNAA